MEGTRDSRDDQRWHRDSAMRGQASEGDVFDVDEYKDADDHQDICTSQSVVSVRKPLKYGAMSNWPIPKYGGYSWPGSMDNIRKMFAGVPDAVIPVLAAQGFIVFRFVAERTSATNHMSATEAIKKLIELFVLQNANNAFNLDLIQGFVDDYSGTACPRGGGGGGGGGGGDECDDVTFIPSKRPASHTLSEADAQELIALREENHRLRLENRRLTDALPPAPSTAVTIATAAMASGMAAARGGGETTAAENLKILAENLSLRATLETTQRHLDRLIQAVNGLKRCLTSVERISNRIHGDIEDVITTQCPIRYHGLRVAMPAKSDAECNNPCYEMLMASVATAIGIKDKEFNEWRTDLGTHLMQLGFTTHESDAVVTVFLNLMESAYGLRLLNLVCASITPPVVYCEEFGRLFGQTQVGSLFQRIRQRMWSHDNLADFDKFMATRSMNMFQYMTFPCNDCKGAKTFKGLATKISVKHPRNFADIPSKPNSSLLCHILNQTVAVNQVSGCARDALKPFIQGIRIAFMSDGVKAADRAVAALDVGADAGMKEAAYQRGLMDRINRQSIRSMDILDPVCDMIEMLEYLPGADSRPLIGCHDMFTVVTITAMIERNASEGPTRAITFGTMFAARLVERIPRSLPDEKALTLVKQLGSVIWAHPLGTTEIYTPDLDANFVLTHDAWKAHVGAAKKWWAEPRHPSLANDRPIGLDTV